MITVEKKPAGTRIINNLQHNKRAENVVAPKGYLTGNEFVSECKSFVTEYYRKNNHLTVC